MLTLLFSLRDCFRARAVLQAEILLSGTSSWSCSVPAVGIGSVSGGLTESCGFGSHSCGTIGVRRWSLSSRRLSSPGIARDFASIGDGRVGVAKVAQRYLRKFAI